MKISTIAIAILTVAITVAVTENSHAQNIRFGNVNLDVREILGTSGGNGVHYQPHTVTSEVRIVSSQPKQHGVHQQTRHSGVGVPERIDAHGNLQRFINGRFQTVTNNRIGGDINSIPPQHRSQYQKQKQNQAWNTIWNVLQGL